MTRPARRTGLRLLHAAGFAMPPGRGAICSVGVPLWLRPVPSMGFCPLILDQRAGMEGETRERSAPRLVVSRGCDDGGGGADLADEVGEGGYNGIRQGRRSQGVH